MHLHRRDVLLGTVATLAAGAAARKSGGAALEVRLGYVSPQTGPLQLFAGADKFIRDRVLPAMNQLGSRLGTHGTGRPISFTLHAANSASTMEGAAAAARGLIEREKVNLMLVGHTPDTTNPVVEACEAAGLPCVSTMAPISPWKAVKSHARAFHFFWDLGDILDVFVGMWTELDTNHVVGGLWPDDPDGHAWAQAFGDRLRAMGWKVVDFGRYPNGKADFADTIAMFKKEKVEILTGVPIPPDFARFWQQSAAAGFHPRVASIGKAILFPDAIDALGDRLPDGLTSEVWWSPWHPWRSALTGKTPADLVADWSSQWTQHLGFVYALFEVAADAVRRADSTDADALAAALATTDLQTMAGPVKFGDDHVSRTPLVGGQWAEGQTFPWELSIVFDRTAPAIPTNAKLRAIPG